MGDNTVRGTNSTLSTMANRRVRGIPYRNGLDGDSSSNDSVALQQTKDVEHKTLRKSLSRVASGAICVTKALNEDSATERVLDILGSIALELKETGKTDINDVIREKHGCDPIVEEFLKESGLLVQKDNGFYEFWDSALQDSLAGRALARNLCSDNGASRKKAEDTIQREKYNEQYCVLFYFAAATVASYQGASGVKRFLSILDKGRIEVSGFHHLCLKAKLVEQWLCEEVSRRDFKKIDSEFAISRSLKKWNKDALACARLHKNAQCGDDALIQAVIDLLKSCPKLVSREPKLMNIVLNELRTSDWHVSNAAVEAMAEIVNATKGGLNRLMHRLRSASRNPSKDTRHGAIDVMRRVVRHCNGSIQPVIEILEQSTRTDPSAAAWVFLEIVKQSPEHIKSLFHHIVRASEDGEYWIRRMSVLAVQEICASSPELMPQLIKGFVDDFYPMLESISIGVAEIFGACVKVCAGQEFEILQLLLETLDVRDEDLNEAAAASIAQMIRAFPDCIPKVIKAVRDHIKQETWRQTYPYLKALIGTISDASAVLVTQILELVMKLDAATFPGVQVIKLEAARHLPSIDLLLPMMPMMMQACEDAVWQVRQLAVHALGTIAQRVLEYMPQMVNALKIAFQDKAYKVRCATMVSAKALLYISEAHKPELVSLLMNGISDEDEDVRKLAGQGVKNVISRAEDSDEQLKMLIDKYNDGAPATRHGVVHALLLIVEEMPRYVPEVMDTVMKASKDANATVLSEAVLALKVISKVSPKDTEMAVHCLEEVFQQTEGRLRFEALAALTEIVVLNPTYTPDLIEMVKKIDRASNLQQWRVYLNAVSSALDSDPQTPAGLLGILLDGTPGEENEVKMLKSKIVSNKSLKQLIDWYVITHSDFLVSHIVHKLYCTPLIFAGETSRHLTRICLFERQGKRTEVEVPKEVADQLGKKIKKELNAKHRTTLNDRLRSTAARVVSFLLKSLRQKH